MQAISHAPTLSAGEIWIGRIVSFLPALFLLVDAVMKFIKPAVVVDTTVQLGYPISIILPLGVVLLISTILYLIPRTSVLGVILLTAYLGGAVAAHVRMGGGVGPIVFPIVIGVLLWAGLYLRDRRLRVLLPLSHPE
jgi:DoxX-like family